MAMEKIMKILVNPISNNKIEFPISIDFEGIRKTFSNEINLCTSLEYFTEPIMNYVALDANNIQVRLIVWA